MPLSDELEEAQAVIDGLVEALEKAHQRFKRMTDYAEPEDILDDPEEFSGGLDDAEEVLSMAYDNLKFEASRGLEEAQTALAAAKEWKDG